MVVIIVALLTLQFFASALSQPTICDVAETLTVDSGKEFSLACIGDGELNWQLPELGDDVSINTRAESQDFTCSALNNEINNGLSHIGSTRQVSHIHIQSITYLATGNFSCTDNVGASTRVYVFVRDPEHLLVDSENLHETISVRNYEDAIIPCRPTAPDVIVTLTNSNGVMEFADGDYDPKFGFKLHNLTLQDTSHLFCHAKKTEDDEDGEELYFELNVHTDETNKKILKPRIASSSDQSVEIGHTAVLKCIVEVDKHAKNLFKINWIGPSLNIKESTVQRDKEGNWISTLAILNATKSDEGLYVCQLEETNNTEKVSQYLRVHYSNESFINLTLETDIVEVNADDEVARWTGEVIAHPRVDLTWRTPHGLDTSNDKAKFLIFRNDTRIKLEIIKPTIQDAGVYTLWAHNREYESRKLTLKVHSSPQVTIEDRLFYPYLEEVEISCKIAAYPSPSINWFEKRCDFHDHSHDNCENAEEIPISPQDNLISELVLNESHIVSNLKWKMTRPGALICRANNTMGSGQHETPLRVTDVKEAFQIEAPEEIVVDDVVIIECTVTLYFYSGPIEWYFQSLSEDTPVQLTNDTETTITLSGGMNSMQSKVQFVATKDRQGEYSCEVNHSSDDSEEVATKESQSVNITIYDPQPPVILKTNLNKTEVEVSSWQPIEWYCHVQGVPKPTIIWLKDGMPVDCINDTSVELRNNNQTLAIKSITLKDEGQYQCLATNKKGSVSSFVFLRLKERTPVALIASVIVVALLLIAVLILLCLRIYRDRQRKRELSLAGLLHFQEGGVGSINPELTLDEQANLLPYHPKWEFPRNKLQLGKQLGAGAFGVVLKAEAEGIVPNEARTTVAVKMVKRHSDAALVRALADELKIMAHLGRHANVVNLLGACTSQLAKRELLVIVEFCKFGNVHNYLLSHRSRFLDQIDPATGEIDITKGRLVGYERNRIQYAELQFARSVESAQFSGASHDTESTIVSANSPGEDRNLIPIPVEGDYVFSEGETLSTSVLVAWAFQIARGMEYLASRRVLHGDLAARNILLAEGNVVKICDFGLARSVYEGLEYRKAGKGLLPVKWLAIESIRDRIFSTQSDVWSFGIVLWELFSLARTPYPGIYSFEDVLEKLLNGYRLEQPDYATKKLYNIMLECWNVEPGKRPSFTDLACKLGIQMEDSVREHYMELNEQYLSRGDGDTQEDYLAMVRSPTYDGSTTPRYVNIPNKESPAGYLDMTSSSWSSDGGDTHEMKPMLGRTASDAENGDYLMPRETPFSAGAVSNPSYHIRLPIATTESDEPGSKEGETTADKPAGKNLYGRISKHIGENEDLSNFFRHPVKAQISFFESFRKKDDGRKTKEGP